jgi:hypothetical protein
VIGTDRLRFRDDDLDDDVGDGDPSFASGSGAARPGHGRVQDDPDICSPMRADAT